MEQSKKESTTKMYSSPHVLRIMTLNSNPGCSPLTRQTSLRRHQFQRSSRSPHQKPPSLTLPHRKLRLLRLSPHPTSPPIRLPPIPHPHQIRNAPTRLPEPKPRHLKPRSFIYFNPHAKQRAAIRSATFDDGRGTTHKHIY